MKCTIQTKVRLHAGEGVVQMTVQGLQVPEEPAAFSLAHWELGKGRRPLPTQPVGPAPPLAPAL